MSGGRQFCVMLLILATVITLLLGKTFLPGHTLFSNDGPLGRLVSDATDCQMHLREFGRI